MMCLTTKAILSSAALIFVDRGKVGLGFDEYTGLAVTTSD